MKSFARSCILCLPLVASASLAAAPDPALVGCWRAVKIILYAQDGTIAEDTSGRCTLQFQEDRFESTCGTTRGTATTTYDYRIVRPNFYLATMTGSTFATSLLGSKREYEYHVSGERLVTVSASQASSPASAAKAPRVESEAARTPCP